MTLRKPKQLNKSLHLVNDWLMNLIHRVQLTRLRLDRLRARIRPRDGRHRLIATACWNFPIYSQTFVYQELTQLIRRRFQVRFLYSKLGPRKYLPPQFSNLWHARRKLILHPSVCERDYAYFAKRMPEKIDKLVDMLCQASGMPPQKLRSHYHFLQAFSFTRMVEAYQPDYLHSYFFYEGSLFAMVASYLLDIPRGVSCYADHMLNDYELKVVPHQLKACSLVIATSDRIKQELMTIAPEVDADRIIVKPNAINASQFPRVKIRSPEDGEPFRLVCVNRIEPKKGLIYLADAVRSLRDRGFNVELHILGGVDESPSSKAYARELTARIEELGLTGDIHLEGRKSESEIKRFFGISQLFIAPFVETEAGDKDGIPTSILEAMASGLPVVGTDAGSITEVICDGIDGILVPQRDSLALANTIEALLCDPDRRQQLGQRAHDKVRCHFDVHVCETIFHRQIRAVIEAHDYSSLPI